MTGIRRCGDASGLCRRLVDKGPSIELAIDRANANVYMHYMAADIEIVASQVLDRCLCRRTRAAARAITRIYDEELRSVGLRPSQVELLAAIAAAKSELSISALADQLEIERTTATRNLRPLEKRGLVVLSPEGRHRARFVGLTSSGEKALLEALQPWERAQAAMESRLGGERSALVRNACRAILSASRVPA